MYIIFKIKYKMFLVFTLFFSPRLMGAGVRTSEDDCSDCSVS